MNEQNKEKTSKILGHHEDEVTAIYRNKNGYFYASGTSTLNETWYPFMNIVPEIYYRSEEAFNVKFQDQDGTLVIRSYRLEKFIFVYFLFSIILCIMTFFLPICIFLHKKIKHIKQLEQDIMVISSGDLTKPIIIKGHDEISHLGEELDHMRLTLDENIKNEKLLHQANNDLITSMSHDLRTPLTSLIGFLEIMKFHRYKDETQYEKCMDKSLDKAREIKDMSDAMFEYALIYNEHENTTMQVLSINTIHELVNNMMDYLDLKGYLIDIHLLDEELSFHGDETMLKRIFNNLTSNLIKYGDIGKAITIHETRDSGYLKLSMMNEKKKNLSEMERNRIGLKSVHKMMELQNGTLDIVDAQDSFTVILKFSLLPYATKA